MVKLFINTIITIVSLRNLTQTVQESLVNSAVTCVPQNQFQQKQVSFTQLYAVKFEWLNCPLSSAELFFFCNVNTKKAMTSLYVKIIGEYHKIRSIFLNNHASGVPIEMKLI